MAERESTATFGGFLSFEDFEVDLPAKRIRIDVRSGTALRAGGKVRDWRPFTLAPEPWRHGNAGKGAEVVGREFAATRGAGAAAEAGLEGDRFEAWLMPVTSFEFSYLVIPVSAEEAGDG